MRIILIVNMLLELSVDCQSLNQLFSQLHIQKYILTEYTMCSYLLYKTFHIFSTKVIIKQIINALL